MAHIQPLRRVISEPPISPPTQETVVVLAVFSAIVGLLAGSAARRWHRALSLYVAGLAIATPSILYWFGYFFAETAWHNSLSGRLFHVLSAVIVLAPQATGLLATSLVFSATRTGEAGVERDGLFLTLNLISLVFGSCWTMLLLGIHDS